MGLDGTLSYLEPTQGFIIDIKGILRVFSLVRGFCGEPGWPQLDLLRLIRWHGSEPQAHRRAAAENFVCNVRALMGAHFRGMERPFALRLGLAGSSPKNWLKRGSAPTWSSLVDLAYRLDIPPAQLCSVEPALTDPQYWRQLPPASLDKPHVRPSTDDLTRVRSELQRRLELEDSEDMLQVEGLPRLAKRLQISLGSLKRNFPDECARLVAQRAQMLSKKRVVAAGARAQRISAAVAAVAELGRPLTSRNLKGTGHLRVSDMVTSHSPDAQAPG